MSSAQASDVVFAGSIPDLYEIYLVPLIFQPYADDLADRLAERHPTSVLELAAGTGVVTRALASRLPENSAITATDLNQPMIDHAATIGTSRPVMWRQADAENLPFDDESFDAIVCQFGVMFFPDRHKAYTEMHRVLRTGGVALFNVWDSIEHNDVPNVVTQALATVFTDDPPRFLARTPHGYHDVGVIRADVLAAGFDSTSTIDTVSARSKAATCSMPAIGFCQGTPLRNEIEARDPAGLAAATAVAAAAIGDRFGRTNVDGAIRAHVITAIKGMTR
ncbi:MAG: class I SAM-dependent methyltransferase [Ilumatobacteraceae bacterium]|nr:class I SAM-dependent methyltransferase [Ilumatobacteraceae bacterium]